MICKKYPDLTDNVVRKIDQGGAAGKIRQGFVGVGPKDGTRPEDPLSLRPYPFQGS
jgi:hypothetical protein